MPSRRSAPATSRSMAATESRSRKRWGSSRASRRRARASWRSRSCDAEAAAGVGEVEHALAQVGAGHQPVYGGDREQVTEAVGVVAGDHQGRPLVVALEKL